MDTTTVEPPVHWFQTGAPGDSELYTAWFQGRTINSWFHLVRAEADWLGAMVKTACGRWISQYDTWDRPGIPGHEWGQDWYACPKCLAIFEREDPERFKRSQTYLRELYAWNDISPADPTRGPRPTPP